MIAHRIVCICISCSYNAITSNHAVKIPVSSKKSVEIYMLNYTNCVCHTYRYKSMTQFLHYVGRTCLNHGPDFTSINKHVMYLRLPCDFNCNLSIAKSSHPSLIYSCKYKHRLHRKYHTLVSTQGNEPMFSLIIITSLFKSKECFFLYSKRFSKSFISK